MSADDDDYSGQLDELRKKHTRLNTQSIRLHSTCDIAVFGLLNLSLCSTTLWQNRNAYTIIICALVMLCEAGTVSIGVCLCVSLCVYLSAQKLKKNTVQESM